MLICTSIANIIYISSAFINYLPNSINSIHCILNRYMENNTLINIDKLPYSLKEIFIRSADKYNKDIYINLININKNIKVFFGDDIFRYIYPKYNVHIKYTTYIKNYFKYTPGNFMEKRLTEYISI